MTNGEPGGDITAVDPGLMTPRSNWPVVIGIIQLIFGALGILGGIFGILGMLMVSVLSNQLGGGKPMPGTEVQAAQFEAMQAYTVPTIINCGVAALVAILLVIAGAGVLKRRRFGVKWSFVWLVTKLIYSIPAAMVGYMLNAAQFDAMAEAAADDGAQMPVAFYEALGPLGTLGVVLGVLWAWVLPVFLLIWFNRAKIKQETRNWS